MAKPDGPSNVLLLDAGMSPPFQDSGPAAAALERVRKWYGFIPNLFLAQTPLPRLIEAEVRIAGALNHPEGALSRVQKELIPFAVSVANENRNETALRYRTLVTLGFSRERLDRIAFDFRAAGLSSRDEALIDFALKLGRRRARVSRSDIDALRTHGFEDAHMLEAVLTTSLSAYRCTLSAGLGPPPDFELPTIPSSSVRRTVFPEATPRNTGETGGPFIRGVELDPESFPPFAFVREKWGFIPNLFRAQTLRPDFVEAELRALSLWLMTGDVLSQRQKECIFLAVSAANLNSYCVAAHSEVLRGLGVDERMAEQIAADHHLANLPESDQALLDVCLTLGNTPARFGASDRQALRSWGFSGLQTLEALAIVAVAAFVNTLNTGLGVEPDFETRFPVNDQKAQPLTPIVDLTERAARGAEGVQPDDPDATYVARVQAGDSAAFEELVRRHGRRLQRTVTGILRQSEEVEDAVQDTFVKAFQHIGEFQGRSRFSTWLTRIAVNTALQRLRGRKEFETLDGGADPQDESRPRQVEAWIDDPEQAYSKKEIRDLIMKALLGLPLKYRLVVMLRDVQQFSTAETAAALGLRTAGVKARLFRGRLMLRDALAPHFIRKDSKTTNA